MTLIWQPDKASPSTAIAEIQTPVVSAPLFRSQRALSEKSRRQIFELGRPTLRPGARPSVQAVQASGGSTLYTPARQVVVSWQKQVQRSTTPNQAQSPRLAEFKVNNTPRRLHTAPSAARPVPAQIVIPGSEENSGAAPQLSNEKVPEAMERPAGGSVAVPPAPRVPETVSLAAEAKTVEDITEPRTKPELHHSMSLPMQKFSEGSISARARKQVYMHSTVFDADDTPNSKASIYDPAQQCSVYDKLAPTLRRGVEPPPMKMPTPQEMKLTMIGGHGLHGHPDNWSNKLHQTPRMGEANGKEGSGEATLRLPHDNEPLTVVRPRPDDGAIPREIWSNGEAHMNGFDLSVRLRHTPRARSKSADPEGSAENRKHVNLSSQITMSEDATDLSQLQPRSTSSACKEIRSLLNQYMFCMDSALDPHARAERKAQTNAARIPQYARDRKSMNLAASDESQFARPQAPADVELDLATPAGTDKQLKALEVLEQRVAAMQNEAETTLVHDEEKRRKNAHFSDLFGLATPRRNSATTPRLSMTEAATCSSLDIGAEVCRKGKRDEVLPMFLEPRLAPPTPRSQAELQMHAQERACWDSPKAFDARVEVSRRRRRARAEAKGLFDDVDAHVRASSASARKRLGMASGQMREAMGASAEVWDDGRAGPGPAQPTGIPMRARSCPSSPSSAAYRRIQSTPSCSHPNSARARYIESVLFSDHF